MAAGHRVGGIADLNISPAKFVRALMDCGRALACGVIASAAS